jgi:hypothetical protein
VRRALGQQARSPRSRRPAGVAQVSPTSGAVQNGAPNSIAGAVTSVSPIGEGPLKGIEGPSLQKESPALRMARLDQQEHRQGERPRGLRNRADDRGEVFTYPGAGVQPVMPNARWAEAVNVWEAGPNLGLRVQWGPNW